MQLLHTVAEHSDENLMTSNNLAVCFAPDILREREEELDSVMESFPYIIEFVRNLIDNMPSVTCPQSPHTNAMHN